MNNSQEATMKRWYESKTIWLGLGTIATAVISVHSVSEQERVTVSCGTLSSRALAWATKSSPQLASTISR